MQMQTPLFTIPLCPRSPRYRMAWSRKHKLNIDRSSNTVLLIWKKKNYRGIITTILILKKFNLNLYVIFKDISNVWLNVGYTKYYVTYGWKKLCIEYYVHSWQISLSCGDTFQIWMWFKYCNIHVITLLSNKKWDTYVSPLLIGVITK